MLQCVPPGASATIAQACQWNAAVCCTSGKVHAVWVWQGQMNVRMKRGMLNATKRHVSDVMTLVDNDATWLLRAAPYSLH